MNQRFCNFKKIGSLLSAWPVVVQAHKAPFAPLEMEHSNCLKLSKTVCILSKVRHFVNHYALLLSYLSFCYLWCSYLGLNISLVSNTIICYPKESNKNYISFSEPRSHSQGIKGHMTLRRLENGEGNGQNIGKKTGILITK